jgi:CheY-like chemotaxis protein
MTMNESKLVGRRVLVADDNATIANAMARLLNAQGIEIVGPVGNVKRALTLIAESEGIDGAILDINLRGERAYPLVDLLRAKGVPIVFMTGDDQSSLEQGYGDVPFLRKPVSVERLLQALFG